MGALQSSPGQLEYADLAEKTGCECHQDDSLWQTDDGCVNSPVSMETVILPDALVVHYLKGPLVKLCSQDGAFNNTWTLR